MSLDFQNQLRSYLENGILQRSGMLHNNHANVPSPNTRLAEIPQPVGNSSEQLNFKQSLVGNLEDKEILLINLYREFTKKDEGKVLAAEFGKLARFMQSEVAKSSSGDKVPLQ